MNPIADAITIEDLRLELMKPAAHGNGNRAYAIPMLDAMEKRAGVNPTYGTVLRLWLKSGGTVMLREDLARPFRHDLHGALREAVKRPCAPYRWDDCWTALDTCWLNVAVRKGIRPPFAGEAPSAPPAASLDIPDTCAPGRGVGYIYGDPRERAPGALPEARDVEAKEFPIFTVEDALNAGPASARALIAGGDIYENRKAPAPEEKPHPAVQQHQDIMAALQLARDVLDAAINRELKALQVEVAATVAAKKRGKP